MAHKAAPGYTVHLHAKMPSMQACALSRIVSVMAQRCELGVGDETCMFEINQSIYLMSWGATGTQQTRSSEVCLKCQSDSNHLVPCDQQVTWASEYTK